jgi:RecB family exonuclease
MEKVITYSFGENFIENLADFLLKNFERPQGDFSRVACVFGGKRPSLFLRRQLSKRLRRPFYPPVAFSMDEFVEYVISRGSPVSKIRDLDARYLIYQITKGICPDILKGRDSFSEFFSWAGEIVSFIEQLDLEAIEDESLRHLQMSAEIGYEVPRTINILLEHIIKIRQAYHSRLNKNGTLSRGLMYLLASELAKERNFEEFDAIVFCNFFYLHRTELGIMAQIQNNNRVIFIFQGNQDEWSVLKENADRLGLQLRPKNKLNPSPQLSLYTGSDLHSQVGLVREVLKKIGNLDEGSGDFFRPLIPSEARDLKGPSALQPQDEPSINIKNSPRAHLDNTVIVLPRPEAIIPLLSEITTQVWEFNVSLGYPLKRSSLFALFEAFFRAQETRKGFLYYAKDYLNVLRHPLVKNIRFTDEPAKTRVLVHKIEEALTGKVPSELGGVLFMSLEEIENLQELYSFARDTLRNMDIKVSTDELSRILKELHRVFFRGWQGIKNFEDFSACLGEIVSVLISASTIGSFAFNLKLLERIFTIKEELANLSFSKEPFDMQQICSVFLQKLEDEMISFSGSPLKGLQILGLFETRSLNFENVIVMDANESLLPKLKIYEPLIPREVMLNLGINRLEKEEEIQRYQFMRLVSGAKRAYLIYEENQLKEKSRFIEELLWQMQKSQNKLEVIAIPRGTFNVKITQRPRIIRKTSAVVDFLKKQSYSATRLNSYLNCPLEFCYRYVFGLSQRQDLLDEPGADQIGQFIHELLESAFKRFLNRKPVIDKSFENQFMREFEEKFASGLARRMKSDSFLLKGIIRKRLEKFLEEEKKREVQRVLCLEMEFKDVVEFNGTSVTFVSKVDRVDQFRDKGIVIIDYKTGSIDAIPRRLERLEAMEFERSSIQENIRSFQLPLYYYVIKKQFPGSNLNAEYYSLRTLERKAFISDSDLPRAERVMEICIRALGFLLSQILDPRIPFEAAKDERKCLSCDFSSLCS